MWILNKPNNCSTDEDHFYLFSASCELLLASYGLETAFKTLCMLGLLLGLLFIFSGRGTYSQVTPRLLNTCVTGCDELSSNQQWVFGKQKFGYNFFIYLAVKTHLVQWKKFRSSQHDNTRFLSWVAVTSNHLNVNSVRKSLVASCLCMCVWMKFKCAFSTHSSPALMFISSTKRFRLQCLQCLSLGINMFVCSVILYFKVSSRN